MVHPAASVSLTALNPFTVTDSYGRPILHVSTSTTGFFVTVTNPDKQTNVTLHLTWDVFSTMVEWFINQPVPH